MAKVSYDYEYIGPTNRLIVTPVTERACIALTQALSAYQCGTLVGPSGSGKTAIVADLSLVCSVIAAYLQMHIDFFTILTV